MTSVYWVAVAVLGIFIKVSFCCPDSCSCKWKNGKQTVSCSHKGLSDIPDSLDAGTQVLDFSGNFMNNLPSELFSNKQLINLQRIYLSNCQIKIINERTFKGLTNLVELDLSSNFLEAVPTGSFADCPSLMRLTLSSNPLKVLKKLAFSHLSFLNTLELRNCRLIDIDAGAFQGLHSLEWLFLNENNLKTIQGHDTLPRNLKGLELVGNPWECDCHMKDFSEWLKSFNTPIYIEPICRGPPRLAERSIKSIPSSELACLPDVSPTTFYLELAEGKNVSLQCHVHSVPEASVSWWFRGQILQNNTIVAPGIHLIYYVEEGSENKRSELFIYNANSEDNGTFICNAENPAGTSQSNFTIKVIIKEDPIVIIVSFPLEYLIAGVVGVMILALIIITTITLSILRCRRKHQIKETPTPPLPKPEETPPDPPKTDPVPLYTPPSLFHLEQNPDLITGMESRYPCDVRWLDAEGYPLDYGLPKAGYFRTLPSGRGRRRRYSPELDHFADVRYTADGYPAPSSLPCCSVQWPLRPPTPPVVKRCVGAQTEEEGKGGEVLTESPDEGYEGEPSVV